MKTFYEKFRDKIDHSDNSVVLFEGEYKEIQLDAYKAGMRHAAGVVKQLAGEFVGNTKSDGTRDYIVYEQGIGMERALKEIENATQFSPDSVQYKELLNWAESRWEAEVKYRPDVNVHKRTLDETWKQVIRRLGGNTENLI